MPEVQIKMLEGLHSLQKVLGENPFFASFSFRGLRPYHSNVCLRLYIAFSSLSFFFCLLLGHLSLDLGHNQVIQDDLISSLT